MRWDGGMNIPCFFLLFCYILLTFFFLPCYEILSSGRSGLAYVPFLCVCVCRAHLLFLRIGHRGTRAKKWVHGQETRNERNKKRAENQTEPNVFILLSHICSRHLLTCPLMIFINDWWFSCTVPNQQIKNNISISPFSHLVDPDRRRNRVPGTGARSRHIKVNTLCTLLSSVRAWPYGETSYFPVRLPYAFVYALGVELEYTPLDHTQDTSFRSLDPLIFSLFTLLELVSFVA